MEEGRRKDASAAGGIRYGMGVALLSLLAQIPILHDFESVLKLQHFSIKLGFFQLSVHLLLMELYLHCHLPLFSG